MPHKIRKTKGIKPHQPKTSRTLIPTEIRYAMLSDSMSGMTDRDIGRKHDKDRQQVLRTITKAKERAERDNRALLDIHVSNALTISILKQLGSNSSPYLLIRRPFIQSRVFLTTTGP